MRKNKHPEQKNKQTTGADRIRRRVTCCHAGHLYERLANRCGREQIELFLTESLIYEVGVASLRLNLLLLLLLPPPLPLPLLLA